MVGGLVTRRGVCLLARVWVILYESNEARLNAKSIPSQQISFAQLTRDLRALVCDISCFLSLSTLHSCADLELEAFADLKSLRHSREVHRQLFRFSANHFTWKKRGNPVGGRCPR